MEWVETTGKTISEAKEAALDELGVDEQDAEFEVLAEPKVGLFGRIRSEGRVRARVRPTTPRAKEDRRDRRRRTRAAAATDGSDEAAASDTSQSTTPVNEVVSTGRRRDPAPRPTAQAPTEDVAASNAEAEVASTIAPGTARPSKSRSRRRGARTPGQPPTEAGLASSITEDTPPSPRPRRQAQAKEPTSPQPSRDDHDDRAVTEGVEMDVALEEQGEVATAFLSGLVERFGLDAAIDVRQPDDDTLNIDLTGEDLGLLIGPKGATLLSIQDLTRTVVQRQTGAANGRIYVDVSGYRHKRGEALARFTNKVAADVLASNQRIALEPMSAPDRKVVHDTATGIAGVTTLSEGEEPRRRVVIIPTED
jgi:spoIIIJ-associated protein